MTSIQTTRIPGMLVLDPTATVDERGTFTEVFRADALCRHGWPGSFVRAALSTNRTRGTLRGLHYQDAPFQDAKLVTCVTGGIFDVAVDLRPTSPAFGLWESCILTAVNRRSVFLPEGVAHGFETLEDESTVLYQISVHYDPPSSRGIRWDDPTLAIPWPIPPMSISDADNRWEYLPR